MSTTTAVCEESVVYYRDRRPCDATEEQGGGTLGQRLASVHEHLRAQGSADCPLCGHAMTPAGLGACCSSCGTRLL